jgi:hypothetical protein
MVYKRKIVFQQGRWQKLFFNAHTHVKINVSKLTPMESVILLFSAGANKRKYA